MTFKNNNNNTNPSTYVTKKDKVKINKQNSNRHTYGLWIFIALALVFIGDNVFLKTPRKKTKELVRPIEIFTVDDGTCTYFNRTEYEKKQKAPVKLFIDQYHADKTNTQSKEQTTIRSNVNNEMTLHLILRLKKFFIIEEKEGKTPSRQGFRSKSAQITNLIYKSEDDTFSLNQDGITNVAWDWYKKRKDTIENCKNQTYKITDSRTDLLALFKKYSKCNGDSVGSSFEGSINHLNDITIPDSVVNVDFNVISTANYSEYYYNFNGFF